tara:strand:+ start:2008 stop:2112 length:105 start_codon:yes stop_codon:yes gene_type:complete
MIGFSPLLKDPFFGDTKLSLELWTVNSGISGFDD